MTVMMTYSPVDKNVDPDLPVFKGRPDVFPLKVFALRNLDAVFVLRVYLALVLESENYKSSLLLSQEGRRLGEIVEEPKGPDRDDDLIRTFSKWNMTKDKTCCNSQWRDLRE